MNSNIPNNKYKTIPMPKPVELSSLLVFLAPLLPIPPKSSKEELNKSKFHSKNKSDNTLNCSKKKEGHIYIQISSRNVKKILKLKKNFP